MGNTSLYTRSDHALQTLENAHAPRDLARKMLQYIAKMLLNNFAYFQNETNLPKDGAKFERKITRFQINNFIDRQSTTLSWETALTARREYMIWLDVKWHKEDAPNYSFVDLIVA